MDADFDLPISGRPEDGDEGFGYLETLTESEITRRSFVKLLGAGLLISALGPVIPSRGGPVLRAGERRGDRGGGGERTVGARLHLGADGTITVLTGKVEVGQGSRAEITQAAAEELRVSPERIALVMADTEVCPDDGGTSGSGTSPRTVPAVRQACAAARSVLAEIAAKRWGVGADALVVKGGTIEDPASKRTVAFAELAAGPEVTESFRRALPRDVAVTPVAEWKTLGAAVGRPNARDVVTGAHRYPSDIVRPGMLRGRVLRPPSFGAKLTSVDLSKAQALDGVVAVRDGDFVGCAAPSSTRAARALDALADAAVWEPGPKAPSSAELFDHLKAHAGNEGGGGRGGFGGRGGGGGGGGGPEGDVAGALEKAHQTLRASYRVAYIQHTPMETRAAVAEWEGEKLTVWTGSQNPFGIRNELCRAFGLTPDRVRVVIPDTGGGFGGKHSGECAIEAARLARAAKKPVSLHWTRGEELTWAYFRPAGLIEVAGGLDDQGSIAAWDFTNINSGGSAVGTPYRSGAARTRAIGSASPLRTGSYRALASTANNFARECFMDELAEAAGADPLAFRLAHLEKGRLRDVLEAAAARFDWAHRSAKKEADAGVGLACGTEKGSYVATCAEVRVDRKTGKIEVLHVAQVFECGKVLNPSNLLAQVQGCIVMGIGGALIEEVRFEDGKVLTNRLASYPVPRFRDVPPLDIQLLDRPDLPPAGAGETPIIGIAPAIANAVARATGVRIRSMPIRFPAERKA